MWPIHGWDFSFDPNKKRKYSTFLLHLLNKNEIKFILFLISFLGTNYINQTLNERMEYARANNCTILGRERAGVSIQSESDLFSRLYYSIFRFG